MKIVYRKKAHLAISPDTQYNYSNYIVACFCETVDSVSIKCRQLDTFKKAVAG